MKVLIVGFGSIARKHYAALKKLKPNVTVYALRSRKNRETDYDIINIFNWNEVPSDTSFAIVSNPTYKHTEVLKELTDRNIPIFIEKPISNELRELDNILTQIEKKNLTTYVACNLRFLPILQFLRNEILSKIENINEVTVYCGSSLPNWRPEKNFRNTYSARKEMGGGVHLDLFHELDYTCWLWGLPLEVYRIIRSKSSLKISAVDYANYQLVYPNFVCSITLNYFRVDPKRTIEIVTSKQTIFVDLLTSRITNNKGEIIFTSPNFAINDTYLAQMNYFIGILEGSNPPINNFSESLNILKICLQSEKAI